MRRQQLIQIVAVLVAINLSVAVVAIFARDGSASAAASAPLVSQGRSLPSATTGSSGKPVGGILAGGQFSHQRGAGGTATTGQSPSGTSGGGTQAASGPTSSSSTSASTAGSPSTGRAVTTTTRPGATSGATVPNPSGSAPTGSAETTPTSGPVTTQNSGAPAGGTSVTSSPSGGHATTTTTARSGPATSSSVLDDRTGDTVIDGTTTAKAESRADIVRSRADYTSKAIVFALQDAQPMDPRQDPNWASDSTYISWQIDTNGDGTPEYEAQYYLASGAPVAAVTRAGDADGNALCDAEAGYTADGYTLAIDPGCLGRPASFSYKVTLFWDTKPGDENADVIADTAPDGGFSRPVSRPAA